MIAIAGLAMLGIHSLPGLMLMGVGVPVLAGLSRKRSIGEITGRSLPGEVVVIGGHLDSWDLGTGAIDDAAGIGITMAAGHLIGQPAVQFVGEGLAVARMHSRNDADAQDLVSEAFTRVIALLREGRGPREFLRAYVVTAVSRLAAPAQITTAS